MRLELSASLNSTGLTLYDKAVTAIAEALSVDEVNRIRDRHEAMRAAAKVAKNKQAEIDLAEIRFRAERKLGELMAAQREAGLMAEGHRFTGGLQENPPAPITLSEAGIDKNLADRARKFAAIPNEEFNSTISDWRERVSEENERVTVNLLAAGEKHVRGTFGTGENEWYTPSGYLDAARKVLGHFDLDPASSETANRSVKAGEFFDEKANGLDRDWFGRVWLNPPYAQPAISNFMAKAVEEFQSGNVTQLIALTHNYTDTRWFQNAAHAASAICFTRGRIRFEGPNGELASPTQGQAFFYFGSNVSAFLEHFREIGFVTVRMDG